MERFFSTDRDRTLLFQRIVLGVIMFPHGMQKLAGWFGGFGFSGTMGFFTDTMHIPAPIAFLIIIAESLGSLGLILGLGTRLAALGIISVMVGAVLTSHLEFGLFMNWFGNQKGEGFEFHLIIMALAIPLVLRGGGLGSADSVIADKLGNGSAAMAPTRA